MAAWSSWIVIALALGGLLGGQVPAPDPVVPDAPAPGGTPVAAGADAESRAALASFLQRVEDATGVDAEGPAAPAGLRNLAALAQQPPDPAQNVTNQTTIPGFGNGTTSHHHGNVGDQGLGAVWATVFHGVPTVAVAGDLDDDQVPDAVLGTDLSVTAVSGATGHLLWARHIGSTVTSVFVFSVGEGVKVGYSTLWEAQTPRVGVLDGRTGSVVWEHIGERPFLAAAAVDEGTTSDIVAVDIGGVHRRLAWDDGSVVWEFETDLLPDDLTGGAAPDTVYANLGHYLAKTGDVNGDGITDTVSVGAYHYAAGLNLYALIHAVDGATGQRLWLTNVGADPHVIHQALVYDIELLDAQGDGSLDVAYSFLVLRVDVLLPLAVIYWEQGWRVSKGDSNTLGVPIASRTIVTPVLPVETFPDLEHTDVDGDGRHELAVLRLLVSNTLLGSLPLTYERYALPVGSTGDPTLLAVTDATVSANADARVTVFDRDGDGGRDHGVAWTADGLATWTVVTAEGAVLGPFDTGRVPVSAAVGLGPRVAVATRSALQMRPAGDLAAIELSMPLRGAPREMRLADADADGTPDLFVLASDGAVHVIDGVTGVATRSTEVGQGATDIQVTDLGGGPALDFVVIREDPLTLQGAFARAPAVEGIDGDDGSVRFSRPVEVSTYRALEQGSQWFDADGDGGRDVLHEWDWPTDTLVAVDGRNGRDLWVAPLPAAEGTGTILRWLHATTVRLDGQGDDLALVADQGLQLVDGATGRDLGWHAIGGNGTEPLGRGPVTCLGGADGDGDGLASLVAVHSGSVGDLARVLVGTQWEVLDWVPDESEVMRCDLRAVANGDGSEDLLVSMVWVTPEDSVFARIGRFDLSDRSWVWETIQPRPDVESEAYFAFGAVGDDARGGTVFLAWQDHVYALHWANGTLIGEFTVNGPFVLAGADVELDGLEPSEAVVLAADGIVWALAEDRGAVATRLATKAAEEGKPNNYGPGSSFEAPPPPPETGKGKSWIPAPPLALLALALVGATAWQARRGNR